MSAPSPQGRSYWPTILFGMFLIAVIAPLSQFLTIQTVNADIETATPVAWAVGLVFSALLSFALLRVVVRRWTLPREQVVLLYCMLTIAVPLMNLGLVRLCYLSITAVAREYLVMGNSTYRTAYNAQDPLWFPMVPTREGLEWNRVDRLLRLLTDEEARVQRQTASRVLLAAVRAEQQRLDASGAGANGSADMESLRDQIPKLGPDETRGLLDGATLPALQSLDLETLIAERAEIAGRESADAVGTLADKLAGFDEFDASLLSGYLSKTDRKTVLRVRETLAALPETERLAREENVRLLEAQAKELGVLIAGLSATDREALRARLAGSPRHTLRESEKEAFLREARSFIFRIERAERKTLTMQSGLRGEPDQNLGGMKESLWSDLASSQAKRNQSIGENFKQVLDGVPWHLWILPILLWSGLFTLIFLALMCLAEWLRRKWVERENLAFPLVDVADSLIRHDFALEAAEDPSNPPKRKGLFSPLFLIGALLSFLYVSAEALGHYEIIGAQIRGVLDVSSTVFSTGNLKELVGVILVLSPIVLGIAYLVNLEVSFSIWVSFVLMKFVSWRVQMGVDGEIRDALYTGWGGGRFYPFPMEQMLGATLCFSAVLLFKTWMADRHTKDKSAWQNTYLGPRLTRWGLILLPVLIAATLWAMGVRDVLLLSVAGIVVLAQTLASARARAETGLPTHHSSYEFGKIPMVFGMTGISGSAAYVSFISLAFLPVTLLFRTLPQQLENLELARRFKIRYATVAWASLAAFLAAIGVGMISFLLFSYYFGETFYGAGGQNFGGKFGPTDVPGMMAYPLYVSHFFGEHGLDQFTQVHWLRVGFIGVGFVVVAMLMILRGRFLKFPINPIGYLVVLLSFHYEWVNPYVKGVNAKDTSWLWGSVFLAWLIKKLVIKYGGMNAYKGAKPFFIGLVVGAVFCVFSWNMVDLACSILAENASGDLPPLLERFRMHPPFSPRFY